MEEPKQPTRKKKSPQIGIYCGPTFKAAFRRYCNRFGVDMANLARYFVMREFLGTPEFLALYPEPEAAVLTADFGDLPDYAERSQKGTQIGVPFKADLKEAIDTYAASLAVDKSSMFRSIILDALKDDEFFNLLWDAEEAILAGTHETITEELVK